MQCKDAFPVLFLYLGAANAFKPANVVFLSRAGGALGSEFTNLAMRAKKKRWFFLSC